MTGQIEMSREMELILCSARPRRDGETTESISGLLEGQMDWDRFLSLLGRHRVTNLLYRNLMSASQDKIPPEILLELQKTYLHNASRNLLRTRELLRIIGMFEDHGIPTVPFKGPTLAVLSYGDLTLRSFNDLDIIVHKKDVLKARDLLTSGRYRPLYRFTPHQERRLLASGCEYNFVHNDTRTVVEVHWRFNTSLYSVPFDDGVWDRLNTAELEGEEVRSFSCEDLVLLLCTHAAKHGWTRLYLVSDLAGLIQAQDIDWDFLNFKAGEMGIRTILHIGLLLSHGLLGADISKSMVKEAARDSRAEKLILDISRKLLGENEPHQELLSRDLFWYKTRERPRDRFRYIFGRATEPNSIDYDLISLPEPLYPFYRIIRPARLFVQYGLKSFWNNPHEKVG